MSGRVSKLLISEPPLQVLPSLAVKIGLNEALVLQQIHYWLLQSKHKHDGRAWIYNSYEEWQKQFPFWSKNTLWRAIKSLENQGLVLAGNYNIRKTDRTKWYTINYDAVALLDTPADPRIENASPQNGEMASPQNEAMHHPNTGRPLPETNSETTPRELFESSNSDGAPIEDLLVGIAQEFGDKAPEPSLRSQARRLCRESGMSADDFAQLVYAARSLTRQYQGKQGTGQIDNKAAYFLTTLRRLLAT